MPTDNQYDEILDKLADTHQQRLSDALVTLEERVADVMADAPLKGGKLFDTEWAINARPQLREAMDDAYLSEVDAVVRGYGGVATDAQDMLGQYGDFTKLDPSVINQLQTLSFQGFESVANEYLDVLANEVYQSTLTGRSFNDTVKNLRQTINGVYIQSDDVEAQRLVDIVNNGTATASKEAAEQLRTKFARDRAGNNLRRYSTQMAQDSLMQFDASINTAIGKSTGATKWKYYGDVIRDSRPFCRQHSGQVFTDEEIDETWAGSWQGKSSGDPFIVRGGYNCRHHWRPVFDEEDIVSEPEIVEPPKPSLSIPVGLPPIRKKKEIQQSFDERTKQANLKGSANSTQSSSTGYVLTSDGNYATRFNHGASRQRTLSYQDYNQKIVSNNNLQDFTSETLSLVQPIIAETDKMAKAFGVPRIRTIVPTKQKAVADMGDGVLGLNKSIYNGYGKKAYTSEASLLVDELKLNAKLQELNGLSVSQYETYLATKAEWKAMASGNDKVNKFTELDASIQAYNKTIKTAAATRKKLDDAVAASQPKIANPYKRGGDKAKRPFNSGDYFAKNSDLGKTTIFHEFGHNVHQQYFATRQNLRNPPMEKWLKSKFTNKSFYPTKYSEVNPQEWFAENFALYNMGRKDLVDSDIKDLLDAMVKSKGRLKVHKGFNFETGEYERG